MDNAREGITISDATKPDNPLVYVNKGFLKISGYSHEEIIGRNCRYLQGKDTAPEAVEKIRAALCQKEAVQVELLNYRKNGEAFWNSLSITPVFNQKKELTHFIGVQDDITTKKNFIYSEQRVSRQKLIAETTIEAQEQQRKQLGMELHDNINQILATIKLYTTIAVQQTEKPNEVLERIKILTDTVIEEIRKLSKSLVGPTFENLNFEQTVTELVNDMKLAAPFSIELDINEFNDGKRTEKQKLMLYRIIQEQLNNIIKYAKASHVVIRIEERETYTSLLIKDDGVGFDASKISKGIGLRNISSRLEMESGTMEVATEPNKGCTLFITIP